MIARASVRDRFGHQMAARVLSLLDAGAGPRASIVALLIGGYLLLVGSWRAIFVFQASVATVVLIATISAVSRRAPARPSMARVTAPRTRSPPFRYLLSHPRVVGFTLAGMFNSGAFFG